MALFLGAGILGCARVEEVPGPNGAGLERGPVFTHEGKTLRHGVWTASYPDGSRHWQVRYIRGQKVGVYREWYSNGVLAIQAVYDWDGKPTDDVKRWDEAGNLLPHSPAHGENNGRTTENAGS